MSRIGKLAVPIPEKVEVKIDGQEVAVKGPKGELSLTLPELVVVEMKDNAVRVNPVNKSKQALSLWGLCRTNILNMVTGVSEGFVKRLEINGVGYRAAMKGKDVQLQLGFSHEVIHKIPSDITVKVAKPTEIEVSGIDKQKVGQVAAEIRRYRPPEPYKGKGVKYAGEYIFRKEGKKK